MTFPACFRRGLARGLAGLAVVRVRLRASPQARGESSVWVHEGPAQHRLPRGLRARVAEGAGRLSARSSSARMPRREVVVMEVDLDDMDPLEAVQFVTSRGTLPRGSVTRRASSAPTNTRRVIEARAVARRARDRDRAARTLGRGDGADAVRAAESGFDAQLGIDMQLVERARADGKPIDGLETVDRPAQHLRRAQPRGADAASCSIPPTMCRLLAGDLDAPRHRVARGRPARRSKRNSARNACRRPALYDELLGARNRKWLPKIEALLEDDQDYLVVVGALHFVGKRWPARAAEDAGHGHNRSRRVRRVH